MGATSPEVTFHTELTAAVTQAHAAGGFTEVLRLAQERQLELRAEPVTAEVMWQIRQWQHVEDRSREHAANEALGWTIPADGAYAKARPSGKVLSARGGAVYEEDGETVDTTKRDERWHQ